MTCGSEKWCLFVNYVKKGITICTILFDVYDSYEEGNLIENKLLNEPMEKFDECDKEIKLIKYKISNIDLSEIY